MDLLDNRGRSASVVTLEPSPVGYAFVPPGQYVAGARPGEGGLDEPAEVSDVIKKLAAAASFEASEANPGGGATNELFIYYADDLFSGNWKPHAMNPIMVDASNGRNAGLLKKDGKYFRAAQGFGFDLYGKKISVFEILKITPTEYEEKLVEEILPSYDKKVIGNHHLSSHNGFTVFDTIIKSFLSKAS
ncbi:MAG: hypothetical protein HC867_08610 [Bacteroidia bacterium]|nr:hypothetical protein [Bacteroidia bacterium]